MSAVSASPLRAPWVEVKYSSTVSPSRKFEVMGVSMTSPDGLAISPRIPASCRICCFDPRAPESAIMKIGLKSPPSRPHLHLPEQLLGDLLGDVRPDVDDLVVPLAVGDDAVLVLLLDLGDEVPRILDETALRGRDVHVDDPDAEPGQGRIAEADVLELVEERDGDLVAQLVVALGDELPISFFFSSLLTKRSGSGTTSFRSARPTVVSMMLPFHRIRMRAWRSTSSLSYAMRRSSGSAKSRSSPLAPGRSLVM